MVAMRVYFSFFSHVNERHRRIKLLSHTRDNIDLGNHIKIFTRPCAATDSVDACRFQKLIYINISVESY